MKDFILVWNIDDHPEMGGGTEFELFENIQQVEDKVNELKKDCRINISFCGKLNSEIKFKPVEKVTKWEIED